MPRAICAFFQVHKALVCTNVCIPKNPVFRLCVLSLENTHIELIIQNGDCGHMYWENRGQYVLLLPMTGAPKFSA